MTSLPKDQARVEINPPTLYRSGALCTVIAYGLFLAVPVLVVSLMAVSLPRFGVWTFLLPVLAIAVATFFLPFGFGNIHVARLVKRIAQPAGAACDPFIVQLRLNPRLRSGLRAILDDADDVGWLAVTGSALVFHGDSVRLSIPFEQLEVLPRQSIGWRGLFVYGPRIQLPVSGLPKVASVEFAERSSCFLPGSRRIARALYLCLETKLAGSRHLQDDQKTAAKAGKGA